MAHEPASPAILDDPEQYENHKRRVFEKMEIRLPRGGTVPYIPHKHQAKVHFPGKIVKVQPIVAGRRGGKSKTGEAEALAMMDIEGTATWVGAPTYALTDRIFQPIYRALVIDKIFGVSPVRERNNPSHRYIEMPWGSIIEGKSAEKPASSKGASLDLFIDDECAEHGESYFTEYVGPGLADRQGRAMFPSTPLGLSWFHDYFKNGETKKFQDMGWLSHRWRSEDNPHLDKAWLKQQKLVVSDHVWRQEYLAEFLTRAGMIWEDYRDEYHDGPQGGHLFNPEVHPIDPSWTHVMGIDIGANHPTGCVWVAIDPQDNLWVYGEYLGKGLHQQHAKAIAAKTAYPITNAMISWEANSGNGMGGETVLQAYQQAGVYANLAPKDFDMRREAVAAYMRATLEVKPVHSRIFISDKCTALRHQIKRYRWKDQKENLAAAKPVPHRKGVDDDLCDALGHAAVTKPTHAPAWMTQHETLRDDNWRYGYQNSAFTRSERSSDGYIGIPGIGTLPKVGGIWQ